MMKTPFKNILYAGAIEQLRLLLSDFRMLMLALKFNATTAHEGETSKLHLLLSDTTAIKIIEKDVMQSRRDTFGTLLAILRHTTERPILNKNLMEMENKTGIDVLRGADELYEEINKAPPRTDSAVHHKMSEPDLTKDTRARLAVAAMALRNTTWRLGQIDVLCFQENVYGED